MSRKTVIVVNAVILALEVIALIHDIYAFGTGLFVWYTVDSNVLQLVVSALVLYFVLNGKQIPEGVTKMHFVSAVGLTVTFLIAAFVLAPEGGIKYYFLSDVAPINHFIGPLLSVISLVFLEKTNKLPIRTVILPALVTLIYGIICLILNGLGVIDGPYFFLKINEVAAGVIIMWFAIIAVLCVGFSLLYYIAKWRKRG
ncbi:hypothetical protein [Butyrivibrio sp. NC2002]|uniref:hypothetical protein n=1 Tax=Butyrivibrio sp. NC2002 TaxID=1410610 RepID=UPI00055D939D|nr:hypothetical protein [Butyrivibrio sp. NC2002]